MAFTVLGQSQDLSKAAGLPPMIDVSKTTIESSKHWLDVDYTSDVKIGNVIYGSTWFSNNARKPVLCR